MVAGFIIGTISVTTAFSATGIKSAKLSNARVTLDGVNVPLDRSLVAVTMDNETNASLYMPVRELLEYPGYTVKLDSTKNTVNLGIGLQWANNNRHNNTHQIIGDIIYNSNTSGNAVLIINTTNAFNVAESGSFQADNNQTLVLEITSTIKGGVVDLFLFDPSGREQRITIGNTTTTGKIALAKGIWQYNCSGMFKDGGSIKIVGTIR